MANFGTDGDATAGIATPTPGTPLDTFFVSPASNAMHCCGGVVGEAGTPTHVSIWFKAALGDPMNAYIGVYKGGTDLGGGNWSPEGATLIGVTANLTYGTVAAGAAWYQDIALTGTAAFASGDRLWLAVLNRKANQFYMDLVVPTQTNATRRGDWTQDTGTGEFDAAWIFSSVAGTAGPPDPAPSGGAADNNGPFAAYITYSTGGGSSSLPPPKSQFALLGVG